MKKHETRNGQIRKQVEVSLDDYEWYRKEFNDASLSWLIRPFLKNFRAQVEKNKEKLSLSIDRATTETITEIEAESGNSSIPT